MASLHEMTIACGIEEDHEHCQRSGLRVYGRPCACPCHEQQSAQTAVKDGGADRATADDGTSLLAEIARREK